MKKKASRVLSSLLCMAMVLSFVPATAWAADVSIGTAINGTNYFVTSSTEYNIAPGVTESSISTNIAGGGKQTVACVMEVDMSSEYATIAAGYGNTNPAESGWTMTPLTNEAAVYESAHDVNVVGGVNASLFSLTSGEPMGIMVMDEVAYKGDTFLPYLAVFDDGSAGIFEAGTTIAQAEATRNSSIKEAISGWVVLVKDGSLTSYAINDSGTNIGNYPRSAVGIKADGTVVLFQADGHQSPRSAGYTLQELAYMMQALGCVDVLELDEGGSSEFVSQREGDDSVTVRSTPSDGSERSISTSILVVSTAPSDGNFDHLSVTPNDQYYTPGSTVELSAFGVDYAGAETEEIPTDLQWTLSEESQALGTIEQVRIEGNTTTAQFISNGTTGKVQIDIYSGSDLAGTTVIGIYAPDTLAFTADSINLDYEEVSDLGLTASYGGKAVNLQYEDITWEIDNANAGTFSGLNFTVTSDYLASITTKVRATYGDMTAELTLNVGMEPTIVMDGGDSDGLDYSLIGRVVARVNNPWGIGYWEKGSVETSDLITAHYTNYEADCSNASMWRGGNESGQLVTTDDEEWVDIIRFGTGAVQLSYDFSGANGIEGACLGFANDVTLTGSPTAIGFWVYAPEGTTNLWLRGVIDVETAVGSGEFAYTFINFTERADTAYNNSNGTDCGGINWTGWKYVQADLSAYTGRAIKVMAGELVRIMYTNGRYGPTIGGQTTGMGNLTKDLVVVPQSDVKGYLLIDNIQFVYGTDTQDTVNPQITKLEYSYDGGSWNTFTGNEVLTSNDVYFRAWYNDSTETDRYNTGIADVKFYFDGNMWDSGTPSTTTGTPEYSYKQMTMADGAHSFRIYVKDNYGNSSTETVYFQVAGDKDAHTTMNIATVDEAPVLGGVYNLNITTNKGEDFAGATINLEVNSKFPVKEITFPEGVTGTYSVTEGSTVNAIVIAISEVTGLSGEIVLASVSLNVPGDIASDSVLTWQVTKSAFTTVQPVSERTACGFANAMVSIPVASAYLITNDTLIAGVTGTLQVSDPDGKPATGVEVYQIISGENVSLGKTDESGRLTTDVLTSAAGTVQVFAKSDEGTSFVNSLVVYGTTGENTPYYILENATENPQTQQNISWMINPEASAHTAVLKVSANADMSDARTFTGTCTATYYAVTGLANYVCNVTATELTAGTTYYYQVGDGNVFSDVGTFDTDAGSSATSFFVIGDMQGEDAVVAGKFSDLMKNSGISYQFGIQAGDAVDNVQNYTEWESLLNIFSTGIYGETDLIHVIGNHEEFNGDANADKARAVFGIPLDDAEGWYSVEYGNVYVAVMGYTLDTAKQQAALNWLAEDAAASNATWKVLAIHVPVYYTNNEQTDSLFYTKNLPAVAEAAGIDFVFSGHDHCYARTPELVNGEENEQGVVYTIVGTAGEKKYFASENGFNFDIVSQDYDAIYVSVTADKKSFTMTAYNVDEEGNATVFDTYTKTKPECEHQWIYDPASDTVLCSICEDVYENYTGLIQDTDGNIYYFIAGEHVTGWQQLEGDWYYFGVATYRAAVGTVLLGNCPEPYEFGSDGKLLHGNWVTSDEGIRYYYGPNYYRKVWATIDGERYAFDENGYVYTGKQCFNFSFGDKQAYVFDDTGKLVETVTMTGLFTDSNGEIWYLIDGQAGYVGLVLIDGYYYYIRSNTLHPIINEDYYIWNTNGLMNRGTYTFDEQGRMVLPDTSVNGIVTVDGVLYYYKDGVPYYAGLIELDGNYYYVRTNGQLAIGSYYITKTNDLMNRATYQFDETGKMILPDVHTHTYVDVVTEPTCTEQGYTTHTCSGCGDEVVDTYVDALGHSYVDVVTEPTCTEKGYTTHTCSVCGDEVVDAYVDALDHSYVDVVTEPTCTEKGYTTHTCSVCGDEVVDTYVDALGHSYVDVVTEPTCTEKGYTTHTCSVCGDEVVDTYVDALGHSYVDVVTEPTCTEKGYTTHTCSVCGDEVVDTYVEALGHSYVDVVTEPTCTEKGYTTHTCSVCGDEVVDTYVDALGHSYVDVVTEPTCTEQGYTTHTCTVCSDEVVDTYVDALGHSYVDVVTEPTCTEKGYTTHTCSVCGDEVVDTYVDALGHSYVDVVTEPTCTEKGYTTHTCSVCGNVVVDSYTPATGHSWDEGVYNAETGLIIYTCTVCGETRTASVPDEGHIHHYEAVVTDPTCTEQGYTTYTCNACGDSYVDNHVAALGHDYKAVVTEPTCTEQGYTTYTCSVCGDSYVDDYTAATGHDWGEWVITKEATETEEGLKTRTCALCGEVEAETIPVIVLFRFADDNGEGAWAWASDFIYDCYELNLISGYEDNTFLPEKQLTRAEAASIVAKALQLDTANAKAEDLSDISGHWAEGAIAALFNANIISGYPDGTFLPDATITRAEIAAILVKAGNLEVQGIPATFSDVAENHWAAEFIGILSSNGIVSGYPDGTFGPGNQVTRAEMAVMAVRTFAN